MKDQNLSRNLATATILVGGALLLVAAIGAQYALYGISDSYKALIETRIANQGQLKDITIQFKTQVLEWKNTLLRGQEPARRDIYWNKFIAAEDQVNTLVTEMEQRALTNETRKALQRFSNAHKKMAQLYRNGLQTLIKTQYDQQMVDDMLHGIDRNPTAILLRFSRDLEQEIRAETKSLRDRAINYFILTVLAIVVATVVVALGVIAIVRSAIETEVAARTRSDFLAKMSHEIRTPMNGVLGMSELLAATSLTEQQQRYNRAIFSSGQSLLVIINDLLDYSRIEAGKLSLEKGKVELRQMLGSLYDLFIQRASEKEISWHIDIAPEVPNNFQGDTARISQILVNIVGNALKFTDTGGVILHVSWSDQKLCLSCADTGIGMSKAALDRLFIPFEQADDSIQRRFGGTGLGLVISHELARQMGGELRVTSIEGQGSNFRLTLPLVLTDGVAARVDLDGTELSLLLCIEDQFQTSDYLRYCRHWQIEATIFDPVQEILPCPRHQTTIAIIDQKDHEASDKLAAQFKDKGYLTLQFYDVGQTNEWVSSHGETNRGFKDRPPFAAHLPPLLRDCLELARKPLLQDSQPMPGIRPLNILAADDNSVNRTVIEAMLTKLGHKCTLATNGEEAVAAYIGTSQRFDCVLMDCEMPVLNGVGALRCIREIEKERQMLPTPVLALTANAFETDREEYLDAGMDEVLTKPISLNSLKTALRNYVH